MTSPLLPDRGPSQALIRVQGILKSLDPRFRGDDGNHFSEGE